MEPNSSWRNLWGRAPQLTLSDAEALGHEAGWKKDAIEEGMSKAGKSLMLFTSEPSVQHCNCI